MSRIICVNISTVCKSAVLSQQTSRRYQVVVVAMATGTGRGLASTEMSVTSSSIRARCGASNYCLMDTKMMCVEDFIAMATDDVMALVISFDGHTSTADIMSFRRSLSRL